MGRSPGPPRFDPIGQPDESQPNPMNSPPGFPHIPFPSVPTHPAPHVLVNGAPSPSTAFALLGASCPRAFRALTATEAAAKFLADGESVAVVRATGAVAAAAVPTLDAVAALAMLSRPELAANAQMLAGIARGGLLNFYPTRDAARAAMALARATDPASSPFPREAFLPAPGSPPSDLTIHLVPLLSELVKDMNSHSDLWHPEDALYEATLEAIRKNLIRIDRRPDLDLAVVEIDPRIGEFHESAVLAEIAYPGLAEGNGDAPPESAALDPVLDSDSPARLLIHHDPEIRFAYTQLSTVRLLVRPESAPRQHDLVPVVEKLNAAERAAPSRPNGVSTFWSLDKDGKGFACRGSGLQWDFVRDKVKAYARSVPRPTTHFPSIGDHLLFRKSGIQTEDIQQFRDRVQGYLKRRLGELEAWEGLPDRFAWT